MSTGPMTSEQEALRKRICTLIDGAGNTMRFTLRELFLLRDALAGSAQRAPAWGALHAAWHAVGADLKGLNWNDFVGAVLPATDAPVDGLESVPRDEAQSKVASWMQTIVETPTEALRDIEPEVIRALQARLALASQAQAPTAAQPPESLGASPSGPGSTLQPPSAASAAIPGASDGWRARVNRRREKAEAKREVLLACIEDIRKRARETPAWERPYLSAITAIEIRLAAVKE